MKIDVAAQSYNTHGGAAGITPVGEFLTRYLQGLEPARLTVEITACCSTAEPPLPTLETLYEDFHRSLGSLPSVRYSPKNARVEIRYASRSLLAKDAFRYGRPSLRVFSALFAEITGVLSSALENHKKLRAMVSLPDLRAAIATATQALPGSASQLAAFVEEESRRAAVVRAGLSPWDRLQIDWTEYHAAARELLDDPFYWDEVDEYAPHGNDTGADILHSFRAWRRRNRSAPASRFLPLMMKRWNFEAGVRAWSLKPLSEWNADDSRVMSVHDEAAIAVAFAQIKFEAGCDPDVGAAGLQALARQLDPEVHAHLGWAVPAERQGRLRAMQSLLLARRGFE